MLGGLRSKLALKGIWISYCARVDRCLAHPALTSIRLQGRPPARSQARPVLLDSRQQVEGMLPHHRVVMVSCSMGVRSPGVLRMGNLQELVRLLLPSRGAS